MLKRRAWPTEVTLRRVLREAGARVVPNGRLRDTGVPGVRDDRSIEAVAFGLPCGVPVFADITVVSPLKADGTPAHSADSTDGAAALAAEQRKRTTYPELVSSPDARLQVVAIETGGRWSASAAAFVSELAWARARAVPRLLQAAAAQAWFHRWSAMLAVAVQSAYSATLLNWAPGAVAGRDGGSPVLSCLLASEPPAPSFSRLPGR